MMQLVVAVWKIHLAHQPAELRGTGRDVDTPMASFFSVPAT